MRKEQMPLYAIAAAILIVGMAFAGVSLVAVLPLLVFLACPLMMFLMMRNMDGMSHGGHHPNGSDRLDPTHSRHTMR